MSESRYLSQNPCPSSSRPATILTMKLIRSSSKADAQVIHDRLYAFNCAKTGEVPREILLQEDPFRHALLLVDEDLAGTLCAGLVYRMAGEVLEVDFLFVSEAYRGQGAGMQMIEAVKHEAMKAGCSAITLFTFGFQAPAFYPKAGFALVHIDKNPLPGGNDTYHYRFELMDFSTTH